jgi:hypothetical protein
LLRFQYYAAYAHGRHGTARTAFAGTFSAGAAFAFQFFIGRDAVKDKRTKGKKEDGVNNVFYFHKAVKRNMQPVSDPDF